MKDQCLILDPAEQVGGLHPKRSPPDRNGTVDVGRIAAHRRRRAIEPPPPDSVAGSTTIFDDR